jgi:hypothetical protein
MPRNLSLVVVMALLTVAGEARAQYGYPQGYGGNGWGGWGSTPGSSMARGLGAMSMGRGAYNEETAVARSINANTVMNWNNSLYQASQVSASRWNAHVRAEMAKTQRDRTEVEDRLRNHPEQLDITNGNALNIQLDVLLNPASADRSLRSIKTPLRHDIILDIPFEYASEGMTFCLDRMTMEEKWPLALRIDAFKPEREAVRKAVTAALEADKEGNLEPATIDAVHSATEKLRLKFEKTVPETSPDYYPARDAIKAMTGLTKMLYSPQMDQILAELDDYQGTTLGDLLGFMQAFNLRFAPSNSFRQRQIYLKLYPMLIEQVKGPLGRAPGAVETVEKTGGKAVKTAEAAGGDAIDGLKSAAIDFFKDMKVW